MSVSPLTGSSCQYTGEADENNDEGGGNNNKIHFVCVSFIRSFLFSLPFAFCIHYHPGEMTPHALIPEERSWRD